MSNREIDRMFAYHERTKHSYASVHSGGWFLDWDNQPNPFRRYIGAPRIELPPPGTGPRLEAPTSGCLLGLGEAEGGSWPERALPLLGALLFHSLAVSAWKHVAGTDVRYSLRVNPSSGNLHPTEAWIAAAGFTDLPDGLYHYDVRGHALERRRDGDALAALDALAGPRPGLPAGPPAGPPTGAPPVRPPGPGPGASGSEAASAAASRGLRMVLTSIFWREAWKYRDRAYRYCLHDAGHAAASVATAARGLGLACGVLGHFADRPLEQLMALDGSGERPLLILDVGAGRGAGSRGTSECADLPSPRPLALAPPAGTPNVLSVAERPYPLIDGMHLSTQVDGGRCPAAAAPPPEPEDGLPLPDAAPAAEPLGAAARRRRSALDYRPEARASLEDFAGILRESASLPRCDFLGNLEGGAPRRLVDLYCYAHRVEDLPPGCYRYLPGRHALLPVRPGDVRAAAAGLSLGQELAGNAIAAFSMIADLGRGARAFGNRAYRHAHVEAGMVGQGLYLAATARGLDATGIGAFYDDDVHRWLGLVGRERQVVYHHSIGKAVVDPRLLDSDRPAEVRDAG